MKGIKEDTIAKISWGILGTMALGLMGLTSYVTKLADAEDSHGRDISEMKPKVEAVSDVRTDVAVIKEQVIQIKQMLEEKHGE